MVSAVISLLVLILLFVLFAWLTRRAWGAKNVIIKFIGIIFAGLVTVLLKNSSSQLCAQEKDLAAAQ